MSELKDCDAGGAVIILDGVVLIAVITVVDEAIDSAVRVGLGVGGEEDVEVVTIIVDEVDLASGEVDVGGGRAGVVG